MAEGLELYEQPLAPTIGIQAQLPILLSEYSFHSLQDVEDYLSLLSQLDSYYGDFFSLSSKNLMPDSVCPTLRSTGSSNPVKVISLTRKTIS